MGTTDGSGVLSAPFVGDNVVATEGPGVPSVIGEGVLSDESWGFCVGFAVESVVGLCVGFPVDSLV